MSGDCRHPNPRYREADWVEPHGEHCRQEWWECDCGERFTEDELSREYAAMEE